MHITNNPNYYCATSKNNPYIDVVVFKHGQNEASKMVQIPFLTGKLSNLLNVHPYIVASKSEGGYDYYSNIAGE